MVHRKENYGNTKWMLCELIVSGTNDNLIEMEIFCKGENKMNNIDDKIITTEMILHACEKKQINISSELNASK